MIMKKVLLVLLLLTGLSQMAFAGVSDWNGRFVVEMENKSLEIVTHSQSQVHFMFFTVGKCLFLSKGSSINGMVFKQDVTLCTDSTPDTFTSEVSKIGRIVKKTITK